MVGTALTSAEKGIVKKPDYHNTAKELNDYIKETHKKVKNKATLARREEKRLRDAPLKKAKSFQKQFRKDVLFRSVSKKNLTNDNCKIIDLNRIMLCFQEGENKKICIEDIRNFTLKENKIINEGLKFLTNWGIVKEIKEKERYYYVYTRR